MSQRAAALAERFEQANQDIIAAVAGADDEKLQRDCAAENCTAAALACHIGGSYSAIIDNFVKPLAEGREVASSITPQTFDERNARNARENANRTQAEVLALLRERGPQAAEYVRGLSDEELQCNGMVPAMGREMSAEGMIERVLIGHPQSHLKSLQAAFSS